MTVNRGCSEEALSIKNISDQYTNPTELECPKGTPCYPPPHCGCLDEVMTRRCMNTGIFLCAPGGTALLCPDRYDCRVEDKDLKKCVQEWMEPAGYVASLTNLTTYNLCNLHIH